MSVTITNHDQVTNPDGTVSLPFSATDGKYNFTDAIVDSAANIAAMTSDQISAIQTARWDNWYKIITTPVENPNPEAPPAE